MEEFRGTLTLFVETGSALKEITRWTTVPGVRNVKYDEDDY